MSVTIRKTSDSTVNPAAVEVLRHAKQENASKRAPQACDSRPTGLFHCNLYFSHLTSPAFRCLLNLEYQVGACPVNRVLKNISPNHLNN